MPSPDSSGTVRVPAALLSSLIAAVAADRPGARSVELLRQAGYDAGEALAEALREQAVEPDDAALGSLPEERFWAALAEHLAELGWGRLEHRHAHPGVAELVSDDWAEADAAPPGVGCQVTTGLLADLFRRVAGEDVAVLEVECRSRGDARCRFLVGSPAALEALHASLGAGGSADDWMERTA